MSERNEVYHYHDGVEPVRVDPITAYVALDDEVGGNLDDLLRQRHSGMLELTERATERLLPAVRKAFGLSSRWADVDVAELLNHYVAWLRQQRENGYEAASMVAVYGVDVLRLPYEWYVCLWLNLDRVVKHRGAKFHEKEDDHDHFTRSGRPASRMWRTNDE